ncbi:hypothetical protein [Mesobacillus harenae]|uniref:hypothetical protein n=1 Tax=Mesobacillus harenae TaxID=2213203 RepID=UPI0015804C2F|nr:hypothetical protein [Mesobacillus harenae]
MVIIGWLAILAVFIYTSGFALSLWKAKNKTGAIAVFILALACAIVPYLTYFSV